ncbi:NAD-dependent epimerase/dehydratase family protein [Butyrivibrio sp. YAB3001]|uniref:NAD-dependent epimerase/dehydratase family protein n=1 Tax=Butyrivibrio sp. YAB3001 TaxID=1520812 RepID=UPI0008F6343B|nr:NAD(P)-dependent oxidoreductase [Butyrivibrio sp. YAB3001]SFC87365.1 dTDP-glucose 4,6-dehydratase [Butyrivibrio sp. YAB3001]
MDFSALYNKSIMITGATGMIGQNIVSYIRRLNEKKNAAITIIAHGRSEEKLKALYGEYLNEALFKTTIFDVTELQYDGPVDYIIHTASITGGSKQHLDYPMRTLGTAINGTRRVLDLAMDKHCQGVVFLSSLEVYGYTGNAEKNITETDGGYIDTMNPRSSYSEGKRISECMFTAYAKQYGLPAMVARLTASFGAGVSPKDNRVFAQFAKSILAGEDIILKSTGETVRDYCDAMDVAAALLTILAFGTPGQAYNVANMDTEISIRDLAQKFIDLYPEAGSKLVFDLKEDSAKFGYNPIMRNVLDSTKLMSLGWEPEYSIDDMIRHLVESLRKNRRVNK